MLLPVAAMLWPTLSDPDAPGPPFVLSWFYFLLYWDYVLLCSYGACPVFKVLYLRGVRPPGAYQCILCWFQRCSSSRLLVMHLQSGCCSWLCSWSPGCGRSLGLQPLVGSGADVHLVQKVSNVVLTSLRHGGLSILPLLGCADRTSWTHTITRHQCRILAQPLMLAAGHGTLLYA